VRLVQGCSYNVSRGSCKVRRGLVLTTREMSSLCSQQNLIRLRPHCWNGDAEHGQHGGARRKKKGSVEHGMRVTLFRRWWRRLGRAGGIVGTASHVVGFRLSDNHVDGKCVDYLYVSGASHTRCNMDTLTD
jgi:hypothetical protein